MFTTNAKIVGISCEACVKLVEIRLEKIKDIVKADVKLNGKMELQSERAISKNEIKQALKDTEYEVM